MRNKKRADRRNVIKLTLGNDLLYGNLAGKYIAFLLFLCLRHTNKTDFHLSQKNDSIYKKTMLLYIRSHEILLPLVSVPDAYQDGLV